VIEALGYARSIRHCFVAGARALTLELHIDDGLNVIQTEALPAVLDLDVCESEAVLQGAGHLHSAVLVGRCRGAALGATPWRVGPWRPVPGGGLCWRLHLAQQPWWRNCVWSVDSGDQWLITRGSRLTAVAGCETPYGPGAEVTAARNVRRGWMWLGRRGQPHRPNRVRSWARWIAEAQISAGNN
jgi:hypothetical protein